MSIDKIIASLPDKTDAERAKMRGNAERWVSNGTSAQKVDARQLLDALEAVIMAEREELNALLSKMPVSARVAEAFRKRPPTPTEETVIRALLDNPASTSTELSRACGWKGQIWHNHFGTMARNRMADLWPAEPSAIRDTNFYCGILCDFDREGSRFTMKPEVVLGFTALGISARPTQPPGGA
jgi:hypothetical protein